jgi:protein gp37
MIPFDWKWKSIPPYIWFGTTVENEHHVDRLMDMAGLKTWTNNIFISVEPMLSPVDFDVWWEVPKWVIVGGESGANARPINLEWVRQLRNTCKEKDIPFFLKQLGGYPDRRCDISKWDVDLRVQQLPKEMVI